MGVRLHVVVEGQTEEAFVNNVLCAPLASHQVWANPRRVETGRRRGRIFRGGVVSYEKLRLDLTLWMQQDSRDDARFTTMIDLYGLGRLHGAPFPGWHEAARRPDPYERVRMLEEAWADDIGDSRFVPYIQLHEFEALLLASPEALGFEFPGRERQIADLVAMAAEYDSPELIDDGEDTAPSKRIIGRVPQYRGAKVIAGPITAARIGLDTLRQKCRHFHEWLTRLEQLGVANPP